MYINDSATDYWSERYQELPDELGPAADNKEVSTAWMRMKGLRYGGQDGGGDYWVSRSGKVYHFDDRSAGSDPNDDATSDAVQTTQPGYTPTGNAILNTTPVTFWPSQSNTPSDPSYTDIPQTAGIGKYSKQSIRKTALSMPCVQQAINAGSIVNLNSRYTVNGIPVNNSSVIYKGTPGALSLPVTVTFTGSLNSDGSQATGFKACFSASCGDLFGAANPNETVTTGSLPSSTVNVVNTDSLTVGRLQFDVLDNTSVINNGEVTGSKGQILNYSIGGAYHPSPAPHFSSANPREIKEKHVDICNKPSFFYIIPLKEKQPDDAEDFFTFMNDRAGRIFTRCKKDGKIVLSDGKKLTDVPEGEDTVSRILAKTIIDAINGGVDFNYAQNKHVVKIKAFDPDKLDPVKGDAWNDKYYYDDEDGSIVDVADYRNILKDSPFPQPKGKMLKNTITQAAFIGHIICELFSTKPLTEDEEKMKEEIQSPKDPINDPKHFHGLKRECEIINEMTKENGNIGMRDGKFTRYSPTSNPEIADKIYEL